jgi:RimJ/RimL family protein N-acetyltransferase
MKIELRSDVRSVGEFMAAADVAISAAGSTCWELCLLALPSLLCDIANNQTAIAREMQKRECSIHVGDRKVKPQAIAEALSTLISDPERRSLLSRNSRALVDGHGAKRVVSILLGAELLTLRAAQEADCRLLWSWANDPEVRNASFSADPIPWETHTSWFNGRLADRRSGDAMCRIFIAESDNRVPVGQIRFDFRPDKDWDVGISLSKSVRGFGLATELITSGVQELFKKHGPRRIHAYVKPQNLASVKSFERAGFQRVGIDQIRGHEALHLVHE